MDSTNNLQTYEKLNDINSIRGLVTATISIFDKNIDGLMQRIFHKRDFAVQSVVDSLLSRSGPLHELNTRLKLLFCLGVISTEVYNDIKSFSELKNHLNNDENEYTFASHNIIKFTKELNLVKDKDILDNFLSTKNDLQSSDSLLVKVQTSRTEKVVRSCLLLAIMDIYEQLQIESPF